MSSTLEKTDRKMILVVDDNRDAAATLGMFLKLKGYRAHTCYGGREALEVIEDIRPDLVILDLAMPDQDGYQTAALLRTNQGLSIPLIALSGYGQEEDRRRTADAGFDAHLVKPVDFAELIDLLGTMLPDTPQN
ncbi:response regulator [Dyadobacter sp. CY323]|uniref:response regulator n=1 Tax=Dyadobacter sp. CY323 TaxID=2907302 RepID=UPI001F44F53A|nr:response regulator [Dyadobacter sp. CY323]MCE6992966.1 response regulator [Dyadobacter sp. CY323]